jgi:hypothetical protein
MTFLILAHHSDDTAIRVTGLLQNRHPHTQVKLILSDDIVQAPKWTHHVTTGTVNTELRLRDGARLSSDEIGIVFNRLRHVDMPHFAATKIEDREYAVMEMFALLVSWLAGLRCPIINPVSPVGLGDSVRHPATWQILASRAGLPALQFRMTSSRRRFPAPGLVILPGTVKETTIAFTRPAWLAEPVGESHRSVLVVGDHLCGNPPPGLVSPCRHLAKLSGLPLMAMHFSQSLQGKDRWVFTGADPFPIIRDENSLVTLVRFLENNRTWWN